MTVPPPAPTLASGLLGKLRSRADVLRQLGQLPRPLVFTNGVFDVLHRGHVVYLEKARAMGASLVVALNTDASARRLGKGPERPLNNEIDRATVIAALNANPVTATSNTNQKLDRVCAAILLVMASADYLIQK